MPVELAALAVYWRELSKAASPASDQGTRPMSTRTTLNMQGQSVGDRGGNLRAPVTKPCREKEQSIELYFRRINSSKQSTKHRIIQDHYVSKGVPKVRLGKNLAESLVAKCTRERQWTQKQDVKRESRLSSPIIRSCMNFRDFLIVQNVGKKGCTFTLNKVGWNGVNMVCLKLTQIPENSCFYSILTTVYVLFIFEYN